MKKKTLTILAVLIFFALPLSAQTKWSELKSDHFIVEYSGTNRDFARQVSDAAEKYYSSIAEDLGYTRYSNFWNWENRVRIYIYPDHDSFVAASGAKQWSHGIADYQKKEIVSYEWGKDFLDVLLPHELTHLIFRDFVGFRGDVPLWLDEGVAQWEEKTLRARRLENLRDIVRRNMLIPLQIMMNLDIRGIKKDDIVNIRVESENGGLKTMPLKGEELVSIYYLQAFSLVGFLIGEFGTDKFIVFCRQLRDGNNLSDALRHAYPTEIRSLADLDKKWTDYLRQI